MYVARIFRHVVSRASSVRWLLLVLSVSLCGCGGYMEGIIDSVTMPLTGAKSVKRPAAKVSKERYSTTPADAYKSYKYHDSTIKRSRGGK